MGIGFAEGKPLLENRSVIDFYQIYLFVSRWGSIWCVIPPQRLLVAAEV